MASQNWTTIDIPDLSGKTIIVTGGNGGLGYQAVKAYAEKGAKIIMACRNFSKGEEAKKQILEIHPSAHITVMELDLMNLSSILNFATKFIQSQTRLDILLNNAGIMMGPYGLTKDGFENQIGTNHLGHFALTGLLLEMLKKTPKSRVVNVSSIAHKNGVMNYDNLLYEKGEGYTPMKAYSRSKLCNLLFTYQLQRFFESNKIDCMAVVAHPGVSSTNLFNQMASKWILKLIDPLFQAATQPAAMGVLPELRASTDPNAKGCDFYGPAGKFEIRGYPVLVQSNQASHDTESARKLWEASEKLTTIIYK